MSLYDDKIVLQYGEKGHIEYGWSNSIRERILQLNFQLVRTNSEYIYKLQNIYHQLINDLMMYYQINNYPSEKQLVFELLKILYKMIGQTRDIIEGKGEYELTYMMIYVWYYFSPELACYALSRLVLNDDIKDHPYGSWKDIKYFCNFCILRGLTNDHFLIRYAISLVNDELKMDLEKLQMNNNINNHHAVSLVAKWIPREKSKKFGWLYDLLSMHFFSNYFETANNDESYRKANLKCKTEYRKIISYLNRQLDTVQIKQCNRGWSEIDFKNVTSQTLLKQTAAFLNVTKTGKLRNNPDHDNVDRDICAYNLKNYFQTNSQSIKGKRIGMNEFTKQALELLSYDLSNNNDNSNNSEIEEIIIRKKLLNAQWRNHSCENGVLGKMIAMVDISSSMEGKSMNAAVALGIRVAEKSALGKRIMTFSGTPSWINLEDCNGDFVTMVDKIQKSTDKIRTNTNFYAALDKILDTIVEVKMTPENIQDLMLIIFSDMRIDKAGDTRIDKAGNQVKKSTLFKTIQEKYHETGIKMYGKPFKTPHILFWNLRSTNGFPCLPHEANCSMISGFSPVLLNSFCEKGFDSLSASTPWISFEKSVNNKRYQCLDKKCIEVLYGKN